jgi:hypothetical protein
MVRRHLDLQDRKDKLEEVTPYLYCLVIFQLMHFLGPEGYETAQQSINTQS